MGLDVPQVGVPPRMSNTIATLNVKLAASTAGFWKTFTKATKPVENFASSCSALGSKVMAFAGPLAALAAGGSMAYMIGQSMEAIDANAKLSDRLGIATEKLVGLQHAAGLAGVSNELLTGSLQKMNVALADAANKGGNNPFAALGLDPKALANMGGDQAFAAIADALNNVGNTAERAALAQDIFGKSGQELLPLLASGSAGLADMQKEAERLGLTYSRVDAAKVEQANDAMTRARSVFTGLAQTAVIQLAPYIEGLANKFTEVATAGGGLGPKIVSGIESIATGIAYCSDILNVFKAGWYALKSGVALILWSITKSVTQLADGIIYLIQLIPGMEHAGEQFSAFMNGFSDGLKDELITAANDTANAWNDALNGKNQKAVSAFFADVKAKSNTAALATAANGQKMGAAFKGLGDDAESSAKKIGDALANVQKELAQFGMTDSQKKLDDLKALGAGPEQLKQAEDMLAKLDALNAAKQQQEDMQQKAKAIFDETRTPMEAYEAKIGELSGLLNAGAIDWDTYGRAVRKAREELEGGKMSDIKAPELIQAGTAAAIRYAYDMASGSRSLKDDLPKQQLTVAKDQRDYLEGIERNTRGSSPAVWNFPSGS